MRSILFLAIALLVVGCSTASKVNVDLDSCAKRGQIDGINVAQCETVKIVK